MFGIFFETQSVAIFKHILQTKLHQCVNK